jgi:hypothetical protein
MSDEKQVLRRLEKWRLQQVSKSLLRQVAGFDRFQKCFKVRISQFVDVDYGPKISRAFYRGLSICGSSWVCPVCSAKITEKRANELILVGNTNIDFAFMATITIKHTSADSLHDLNHALSESWRAVRSGRWYKDFKYRNGIYGSVSGFEVTYGKASGWHPHKHVLFFSYKKDLDLVAIKKELFDEYFKELNKRGRFVNFEHGLDVLGMGSGFDYVSGMFKEVSKSNNKSGRGPGRYHPFELLDLDSHHKLKFVEYALETKGRHQLEYSPGLRSMLGLEPELSDEEVAQETPDIEFYLLSQLTAGDWKKICKQKLRAHVLEVASLGDVEKLEVYLKSIGCLRR